MTEAAPMYVDAGQYAEADAVAKTALTLPAQARAIVVRSPQDRQLAADFLVTVKLRRQEIAAAFRPMRELTHKAHKEAVALEARADGPCAEAELIAKQAIVTYDRECERQRREAERQAEEERRRLEAEAAERARIETAERQRQAEEARLAEALAAEAAGDTARAERLVAEETPVPPVAPKPVLAPPVVAPEAPKSQGVSAVKRFTYRITDELQIDRRFLIPDEQKIRSMVRALGMDAAKVVGGIVVEEDVSITVRTASFRR